MPLTDAQVRGARYNPNGTGNRLTDGGRMHLQLDKSGAKYWRMNYRFAGMDKTLALAVYPDVSLAATRKKRGEAREKLAAGVEFLRGCCALLDGQAPRVGLAGAVRKDDGAVPVDRQATRSVVSARGHGRLRFQPPMNHFHYRWASVTKACMPDRN